MSNPYQQQNYSSEIANAAYSDETELVISGQRMLMYSILGYFLAIPILGWSGTLMEGTAEKPEMTPESGIVLCIGIICLLASAFGASTAIFRMGSVLYPGSTRYFYAIGVLLPAPLVGLIVMVVANSKANSYLAEHDIKVGLLGAKR